MPRPEQTEKATPKRKGEARGRGQVPRSPDVASAAIFLFFIIVFKVTFDAGINGAGHMMTVALQHVGPGDDLNVSSAWGPLVRNFGAFTTFLGIMFACALIIAIVANLAQFGFLFTTHKLLQLSRLNLIQSAIQGIPAIFFSTRTLVTLFKQLLKLSVVFVLVYTSVADHIGELFGLAGASPHAVLQFINDVLFGIGLKFGVLLLMLALADYAYERWQLERSLKMSKQEVRDEARQAEGNPEAKGAVKKRQREMARKRMMAAVPKATVVVTNPTHYAVALEWDEIAMEAPVLTAKGADLVAKRIKELAKEHGVPVLENAPLARALYERVPLDTPIPPTLYAAVAQIIAFVYRLKNKTISA